MSTPQISRSIPSWQVFEVVSALLIMPLGLLLLCSLVRSHDAREFPPKKNDLQCAHWSALRFCQISGVLVSNSRLLDLLPPAVDGHSLEAISIALRRLGLVCEAYRESWEDLTKHGTPVIAHLKHPNHYIVLCGIDSDAEAVHVYDGDGARTRVTRESFQKRWSGVVLRVVGRAEDVTANNVRFERLLVDKGDIPATGAVSVFDFPFTNVGSEPLRIESVTPSCSCVGVEKPEDVIGSGKSGVIRLTYQTTPTAGAFMQSALVTTSGGRNCRFQISASGYSGARLTYAPARIEGTSLIRGRDNNVSLFFRNNGQRNHLLIYSVTGRISNAVVTGFKVDGGTADGHRGYPEAVGVAAETQRLQVYVRPSDGEAEIAVGSFVIATNVTGAETIEVGFSASVVPPVRVYPNTIVYNRDATGPVQQLIRLVFDESQPDGVYYVENMRIGDVVLNSPQYSVMETSYGLRLEVSLSRATLIAAANDRLLIQLRSTTTDAIERVPVKLFPAGRASTLSSPH